MPFTRLTELVFLSYCDWHPVALNSVSNISLGSLKRSQQLLNLVHKQSTNPWQWLQRNSLNRLERYLFPRVETLVFVLLAQLASLCYNLNAQYMYINLMFLWISRLIILLSITELYLVLPLFIFSHLFNQATILRGI